MNSKLLIEADLEFELYDIEDYGVKVWARSIQDRDAAVSALEDNGYTVEPVDSENTSSYYQRIFFTSVLSDETDEFVRLIAGKFEKVEPDSSYDLKQLVAAIQSVTSSLREFDTTIHEKWSSYGSACIDFNACGSNGLVAFRVESMNQISIHAQTGRAKYRPFYRVDYLVSTTSEHFNKVDKTCMTRGDAVRLVFSLVRKHLVP